MMPMGGMMPPGPGMPPMMPGIPPGTVAFYLWIVLTEPIYEFLLLQSTCIYVNLCSKTSYQFLNY